MPKEAEYSAQSLLLCQPSGSLDRGREETTGFWPAIEGGRMRNEEAEPRAARLTVDRLAAKARIEAAERGGARRETEDPDASLNGPVDDA